MELALLVIGALVLVLGPFALAISISELGKVRENRKGLQQAHNRIDRLVEEKMSPEEREAVQRGRQVQADRDEAVRSLYEHGGC